MNAYIEQCRIRRQKVLDAIGTTGIAVVFAATEKRRSNDTFFPFRQNSDFYYLTGFDEPEAMLVLDGAGGESVFFCRPKNPEREIWEGRRCGFEAAANLFAFEKSFSSEEFDDKIADLLRGHRTLWSFWGDHPHRERSLLKQWRSLRSPMARTIQPEQCADLRNPVHPMRLIKDEVELNLLRRAAKISAEGHVEAMLRTRPDMFEYQIEGELLAAFTRRGARAVAYSGIVAGGVNACILHYVANRDRLRDGDLLLIDAGAEYENYAGDISRTFPVNGRFNPAQRDLYQTVLAVNRLIIDRARVGSTLDELNSVAKQELKHGLQQLKLLSSQASDDELRRFYMHGIGHFLGLDVHDVGDRFDERGEPLILRENMCMTVEPGLYIPDEPDIPAELRGTGVRIEDNIIIKNQGAEVYTRDVPKDIDEIEKLMSSRAFPGCLKSSEAAVRG